MAVFWIDMIIDNELVALAWVSLGSEVDMRMPWGMPSDPLFWWIPICLYACLPVGYLLFFGMISTDLAKVAGSISVSVLDMASLKFHPKIFLSLLLLIFSLPPMRSPSLL